MTIKYHLPEEVAERALDVLRNLPIKAKPYMYCPDATKQLSVVVVLIQST